MVESGSSGKGRRGTVILSPRGEKILLAVHFYRYMTAQDVCYLLYSPSAISYVRKILSAMAGRGDSVGNQYLYRFALPSISVGNPQRVYTLGSRGRDFLVREKGVEVDWYFRPYKVKNLSASKIVHNLFLTRFLVAAKRWTRPGASSYELVKIRTCYELGGSDDSTELLARGKGGNVSVIPDAWLLFERNSDKRKVPVLLEIDRGTAFKEKFKEHVRARVEYVKKGGEYSRVFETEAVVIAYATTGESAEYREARRRSMCSWTMEVLKELKKESWAQVFRFHSLSLEEIYEMRVFEDPVWYRPDAEEPVRLLGE